MKEGQKVFEDEVSFPPKNVGSYPVVIQLSHFFASKQTRHCSLIVSLTFPNKSSG